MKILIRGGRIVDPATGRDSVGDVAAADGRILRVGEAPRGFEPERTIEARGLVVAPGLIDLAARLREPGATIVDAEVRDLSTDGFMAETALALEMGAIVWLKLPGLEPQNSRVAWTEDGRIGCQFATPLHPLTLEMLVKTGKKPMLKGHFGPQR